MPLRYPMQPYGFTDKQLDELSDGEYAFSYAFNVAVNLHHYTGAALALAGYAWGSTTFFRLGVGTEIAEDDIHYAQVAPYRPSRQAYS